MWIVCILCDVYTTVYGFDVYMLSGIMDKRVCRRKIRVSP